MTQKLMESPRPRARLVTVVFGLLALASLASAAFSTWKLRFLGEDPQPLPEGWTMAMFDVYGLVIAILHGTLFLACIIVFLRWFHLAHRNLSAAGARDLRFSPGWAVGGFFIPFANLAIPYMVMREVWMRTARIAKALGLSSPRPTPALLVGCWWALYLAMGFLASYAARAEAETFEELHGAELASITHDVSTVAAAAVAILLVRRVSLLQEDVMGALRERRRRMAARTSPATSAGPARGDA